MPYDVDLQLQKDFVRVSVTGTRRFGDAAADAGLAGRQIVEYCRQAGVYRALVTLKLSGRLSAIDSYEMVSDSENYGLSRAFRLALVVTDEESIEDVRFTEAVAVNRAISLKVFTHEAEAKAWLLETTDD